jgi:hypothetical protein
MTVQWDSIEAREEQPCWCPDSFVWVCLYVEYCPQHGIAPDPDLWDYTVAPFGVKTP